MATKKATGTPRSLWESEAELIERIDNLRYTFMFLEPAPTNRACKEFSAGVDGPIAQLKARTIPAPRRK